MIIIGGLLLLFMYITRLASNEMQQEVGRAKDLSARQYMFHAELSQSYLCSIYGRDKERAQLMYFTPSICLRETDSPTLTLTLIIKSRHVLVELTGSLTSPQNPTNGRCSEAAEFCPKLHVLIILKTETRVHDTWIFSPFFPEKTV
jgi:hypothetical protein